MTKQNPMNPLATLAVAGVLALGAPAVALAHGGPSGHGHGPPPPPPAPTTITVDNEFDGKGNVFLDGRYVGTVAGDAKLTLATNPGCHTVAVRRPDTGFVLSQVNLTLAHGTNTLLPVLPPRATLRVTNAGEIALKLRAENTAPVWVNPGATAIMNVETGNLEVTASIRDPKGEWDVMERVAWVEPGTNEGMTFKPDPTVLVVVNHERFPVHALVDGADLGWIDPGATQETWLRPGRANVVLLDRSGRVRTTTAVNLQKGQDTRVVLQPPVQVRPGVVVTASTPTVVVSAHVHGAGYAYGTAVHQRPGPRYRWEWDHQRASWSRR